MPNEINHSALFINIKKTASNETAFSLVAEARLERTTFGL